MSKLLIRHGLSEANNIENYGTPAFGSPNAPLMPLGIEQAVKMGEELISIYGIDVAEEPVGVSMLLRSQETAMYAGFHYICIYPELNEEKGGLSDEEVRAALLARWSPEATVNAARRIINHPPPQNVIILHAYVIATICQELGVYHDSKFTPKFCEIREVPM